VSIFRSSVVAFLATGLTTAGLTAAGVTTAAQQPAVVEASPLQTKLDTLLADSRFTGSQVGLVVRDAVTGEELYDRNGGSRLLPASNLKLFTSTAAMDALGPDFWFHTDALATAPVLDGKLRGDLYLKGYGDPTTLASDYAALAQQIAAAGIRRVDGDIVGDDSYFDDVRLGDTWSWDDEPFYYSAQISALTVAPNTDYDSGTVIVQSAPGAAAGAPAQLTLVPQTSAVRLAGTVTTGAAGSANTLSIEREHGTNVVHVSGSVPLGSGTALEWVTVWDPTSYAADVFRRALVASGVEVRGGLRTGTTPATARMLANDTSMTLGELLVPFLKLSNNMHAETLVKALGAVKAGSGTWSAGLGLVASYANSRGVDTGTIRLSDGSGLSRKDNLTPDAIADLLVAARAEPWYQQWYDALPIAGNPDRFTGGTLRNRMRNTAAANNLHGKTGSLTGVTALSGYVTDADGRKLVFSMVSNNFLSSPRSVEDAVGVTLASYSETATVAAIRPAPAPARATSGDELECSWTKAC